ncbi:ABC transporter substrate-binding protein [Ramlibacter sp.]|uniref:ABC transporter substrate-binding protein n=1 Tax=Ramlibacter sp. TaxID=1917967 RepID=UPI003D12766A
MAALSLVNSGRRLLCLAALLGCALGTASKAVAQEGQMVWATHLSLVPAWFNPSEHAGSQPPWYVYFAIHDALVKPMPGNSMTPSLAKSWSRSPDGLVYEFVLRENVKFHNGDPVTSEDVKFSFERYKGSAATLLKSRVAAVETPDPLRVRFRLKESWPDFMIYYAMTASGAAWVLPKRYIEQVGDDGFKRAPIGAGPYKFVSFKPGLELIVEANENYWRKKPSVKRHVFRSVPEELTRAAMVKNGEADVANLVRGAIAQDLRKSPGITLKGPRLYFTNWLAFTQQWDPASPFSKKEVRQAVSYAINRKGLIDSEFLGYARPAGSIVPTGVQYAKAFPADAYDPAKAKKMLAAAGYPNGFDGGDLIVDAGYATIAEVVQANLQAVGIRLRLRSLERAAYYSQWTEKKMKGVVFCILSGFENTGTWLEQFVTPQGRGTFGVYPEITDAMAIQAKEVDEVKRERLLAHVQQIVNDRMMFVPIVHPTALHAVGPRVAESGFDLIDGFAYAGPYEDIRLKGK